MEDLLTCKKCLKKFDLDERFPSFLPCQHTICQNCYKIGFDPQTNLITCITCQKEYPKNIELPMHCFMASFF